MCLQFAAFTAPTCESLCKLTGLFFLFAYLRKDINKKKNEKKYQEKIKSILIRNKYYIIPISYILYKMSQKVHVHVCLIATDISALTLMS